MHCDLGSAGCKECRREYMRAWREKRSLQTRTCKCGATSDTVKFSKGDSECASCASRRKAQWSKDNRHEVYRKATIRRREIGQIPWEEHCIRRKEKAKSRAAQEAKQREARMRARLRGFKVVGDHAEVPLTKGYIALLDVEDAEVLCADRNWIASVKHAVYARHSKEYLHQAVAKQMGEQLEGKVCDHINGNTLDNRRNNLRVVSQTENTWNTKMYATNSSGYKGVSWCKITNSWSARVSVDNRTRHIGRYSTPEEAAAAYDAACVNLRDEVASRNYGDRRARS